MSAPGKSAKEVAALIGAETTSGSVLTHVSAITAAKPDSIVFAEDDVTLASAIGSHAGLILARRNELASHDPRILWVRHPKYAFALCARALAAPDSTPLLHPSAIIDSSAKLGKGTRVGAGAVIEADAVIGEDCTIRSNATICRGVVLGDRVIVQLGAVLGSVGFGYVRDPATGEHLMFPQQGTLVIEDDVEVGANTTIDRGALGETRIGRGTKIDNLVHIAHNCSIGKRVLIAAQVGISGSCVIEDDAVLAGQVGLGDHCHIGAGVVLGGQSGVYPGKTVRGPGELFAGTPAEPVKEHMKHLARLRRLK